MVSKFIGAVFVLTLIAGAAHAQADCPPAERAVVPDPIAYSDLNSDRGFYGEATHSALTVIRKARADVSTTDSRAPLYVAYGVDVGNKRVLFQITFASDAELAAFQARLNKNLSSITAENAAQNLPFNWGVSSNLGHPVPPPPPGGPNGIPYAEYLGTRLVQMGEAFNLTQKLALNEE